MEREKISMTQALIFVNCDTNNQETIRDHVSQIKGVLEVHMTTGIYDLILKAETESEEKLREDVIRQIRKIGGIRSTTTMIVFKPDAAVPAAGDALVV
ncbi:MAG: Lrp/AsnC ligand binding domain-containing protein [Nitrososphaera sp.]|uniref:Lrp/AsnC family transcriptional regulator n=1 Tax=Candidatus Nitrososphaera gargensis TaxID=497727 RepID=UPI001E3C1F1C|nr:Lrp/AsnC ligand binding domain-containing protein [Candidatus Nitrososphaera gargensis]